MDGQLASSRRGLKDCMPNAPLILVVARYHDEKTSDRIRQCLSSQTYQNTRLILVPTNTIPSPTDDTGDLYSESAFADVLKTSGAKGVVFWPEGVVLRGAAIEKLVLALELAPGQDGVTDASHGSVGLWLARINDKTKPLIQLWLKSQNKWIEECERRKPALFHIAENLLECSDGQEVRRPYAIESFFSKLPPKLENYQPIVEEPIWNLEKSTDDKSVLFLVSSLPMGGACKFVLDIVGQLRSKGYRVTIATTTYDSHNPNPWLDEFLRVSPDVFVLSHFRPVDFPRLIVHLAQSRRCSRVVLSHTMLGYQLLPWLRTQLPDVSFLDYTHIEYETEWPDGGYALRSVNNQPLLDLSLISSRHLRQWMVAHGSEDAALRVCHTNIDTDKWKPSAENRARDRYELGIPSKTAMILYPCRLAEQKRPELLCNIVAALRRATKTPFVVVVAGNGALMEPLRKFIERENLEDYFKILGAVSLERVARLHNAADIFLLPSLIEGISLALFEAMALESVPVVSDVGGQRELVTDECGYLIPVGEAIREVIDYVAALKHLLENPARRNEMATACRHRVSTHFPLSQMTETFIAALQASDERHRRRAVRLPEPTVCRELATLAIDHIRVSYESAKHFEHSCLLNARMCRFEKLAQKLERKLAASRHLVPEEHEVSC